MWLSRLGGLSLVAFVPLLAAGVFLYGRIGVSSQVAGSTALRRIVDAGSTFPVMNALFHLGALLLLPAGVALVAALRGPAADPWLMLGGGFLILTVVVGAGFVFSLNHGLYLLAQDYAGADEPGQAAFGAAASGNLHTQAGAELVQSLGLSFWLLAGAVAMSAAGWPVWAIALGVMGGIGFFAAGLSSIFLPVPIIGPALAGIGGLGLLMFVLWDLAIGIRLLTLPIE